MFRAASTERVGLQGALRVGRRVPERPGEEAQLQGAPVAHRGLVRVGAAHVDDHRLEVLTAPAPPSPSASSPTRRSPTTPPCPSLQGCRSIHCRASYPSSASGRRKFTSPSDWNVPPAVLVHGDVPALREEAAVPDGALDVVLVVGGAVEDRGEPAGQRLPAAGGEVEVGREPHPVAHLHHYVPFRCHLAKFLRHGVFLAFPMGRSPERRHGGGFTALTPVSRSGGQDPNPPKYPGTTPPGPPGC